MQSSAHGMWSSRLAFILAASGSAVGLGNIWRFPYLTSDNGGGAFVLIYIACVVLVGLPIMMAEIAIGRAGRHSPIHTLETVAKDSGSRLTGRAIGWMGLVSALLILSFYSVVAGWTLHYAWLYVGQLFGADGISDPKATFGGLLGSPGTLLLWHSVFMVLTFGVVALGVEKGLERAVSVLMPALFVLLLVLLGYGISTGKLGEAMRFLFLPDWSKVSDRTILAALGQAFFSLSLGNCLMMAYGAYLPRDVSIPRASAYVAATDTGVALLAGLAIFPVVIAFGISPAGGGPGLIFTSLPHAFADMPLGIPYALLFFLLLTVAAWTSSISLLEPATAYLVERARVSRKAAAGIAAALVWAIGLITVLSFNVWSEVRVGGKDLQGAIEYLAADLMLPLGGLLTALFAGWALDRAVTREQLSHFGDGAYTAWRWLVRVIAPMAVLLVLIRQFG